MQKMRTINAAYTEIKQKDPDSAITLNGLRTLVIKGTIPSVRVGVKYLIAMEAIDTYLQALGWGDGGLGVD